MTEPRPESPGGQAEQHAAPTPGPWEISINPKWTPRSKWAVSREITIRPVGEHPHGLWVADCGLSVDDEQMANARLIAAAPETAAERDRLVQALNGLVLVCGRTGESLKDFEEQAAAFQRETGKMRPGKDVPMAAADLGATPEEYRDWLDGKVSEARAVLAEARKP